MQTDNTERENGGKPQADRGIAAFVLRIMHILVRGKQFKSDDELYVYLTLCVAFSYFYLMTISLMIMMFSLGITGIGLLKTATVLLSIYPAYLFIAKQKYALIGIYMSLSIITFSIAVTFYTGTEHYIHLYYIVAMMLQVTIPYARPRFRIILSAAACTLFFATIILQKRITPFMAAVPGEMLLSLFNASLTFFAITMELLLGNVIRRYITLFNQEKLRVMHAQSVTDELTGLFNRRYAQHIRDMVQRAPPSSKWCAAMLDIDDFKKLNDTLGHQGGDLMLQMVSKTMRKALRKDDIVIRWGGEEFLILLETELDVAVTILDKLRLLVQETPAIMDDGTQISCTVTIGVAQIEQKRIDDGILAADQKLYIGKSEGKNRVVQ